MFRALLIPLAVVLTCSLAHATQVAYQGRLEDASTGPINVAHDFQFTLWGHPTAAGTDVWTEVQTNVPVVAGAFSVKLGADNDIPVSVWVDNPTLYLSVAVRESGQTTWAPLAGRQEIAYVPRAVQAQALTGCRVVTASFSVATGVFREFSVCNTDEMILTGGFLGARVNNLFITENYPDVGNRRWAVGGSNASGASRSLDVYAVCCM